MSTSELTIGTWERNGSGSPRFTEKIIGNCAVDDDDIDSEMGAGLTPKFTNWLDVAATLYSKTYEVSGVNTLTSNVPDGQVEAFAKTFSSNPFWNAEFSRNRRSALISDGDFKDATAVARKLWIAHGLPAVQFRGIVDLVRQLAYFATRPGQQSPTKSVWIMASSIVATGSSVHLIALHSSIRFDFDRRANRYAPPRQTVSVDSLHAELNFQFCRRNSSRLVGYDFTSIQDWEKATVAHGEPRCVDRGWM